MYLIYSGIYVNETCMEWEYDLEHGTGINIPNVDLRLTNPGHKTRVYCVVNRSGHDTVDNVGSIETTTLTSGEGRVT